MNIETLESGVQKEGMYEKLRYDLIPHELLKDLAIHYTAALKKYPANNWKKATVEESEMYKQAAFRHFMLWQSNKEPFEDHGIAAIWNIIAYEWINKYKPDEEVEG